VVPVDEGQRDDAGDCEGEPWTPGDGALDRAKRLIRQAVADQAEPFERSAIAAWFAGHAPEVGRDVVVGLTIAATVNDPRRRHYPEPQDLLFLEADGRCSKYDPDRHGSWTRVGLARPGPHPGLPTLVLTAALVGV
jgi:hypothetical protein